MVRERKVVFEATDAASLRRGRRQIVENQVHRIPPSVLLALQLHCKAANGDVESKQTWAAVDALTFLY
jgi:hypothetical protein